MRARPSYSVGIQTTLGQPDIIMFGFPPDATNQLLWTAWSALKSAELTLVDGAAWDAGQGDVLRLQWRAVHRSQILREYLNVGIIHAEKHGRSRQDMRVFQLVISDPAGHLPREADYDLDYRPIQPRLWEPYSGPPEIG